MLGVDQPLCNRGPEEAWWGGLRAGYSHHRAELNLGQSFSDRNDEMGGATRLQFGSAVAFAGGRWAISRPIRDSFAIVTGHESLKGFDVNINEMSSGAEAQLNSLGPAVVADVQSYYPRPIQIEPPEDLDFGYDLGPSVYSLHSTYRSGARIIIGSEPVLYASGLIERRDGSPFSFQAGEVHSRDDELAEPQTVFTSREGAFTIEGLRTGMYEIQWFDEDYLPSRFVVPADATDIVALETLVVLLQEEKE
jgi:outer membrane usher protein